MIACSCLALLAAAFLGFGQPRAEPGAPQAVYEECQDLERQMAELDAELKSLGHQEQSLATARGNYEYVLDRNAGLLKQLEDWAETQ